MAIEIILNGVNKKTEILSYNVTPELETFSVKIKTTLSWGENCTSISFEDVILSISDFPTLTEAINLIYTKLSEE